LITGVGGFVGSHLSRHLLAQPNVTVFGTTYFPVERHHALAEMGVTLTQADLTDEDKVRALLDEIAPDHIYHLAAQSFVPVSFENPWDTLSNNIHAQLNVLHALAKSGGQATRVLVIGSGETYGPVPPEDVPIDENQLLIPTSPYSVSKVAQDMLGLQYFLSHNLHAVRVRPFNHIGPGQDKRFVAADFANQVASIEANLQEPIMCVGNLEAQRDFTDVRDTVRAYHLLLAQGEPGEVYNVGTGVARSIQQLLDVLLDLTDAPIEVQEDPARFRPVEVPIIACDASKLRARTGWEPEYAFKDTLATILDDWRVRVRVAEA
jgi:GDP-4-dehydro-6-deoxy-D-mannose reductase